MSTIQKSILIPGQMISDIIPNAISGEENSNLPAVINKQPDYHSEKSEEVQSIIDRMPTHWVKWVALCVGVLMGILILLGFLIQYPDTVDGQISVTGNIAPVRLVANSNGRIYLLAPDKSLVEKGLELLTLLGQKVKHKKLTFVKV